jgi:hypothetical protein
MEEYINDDTVVEDDFYNAFKDSITCPLCLCILIEPVMCMKCQNVYCKKCVDDWAKKDNKCPNRCEKPNYQKSLIKNEILSKLKFKCESCKMILEYNDAKIHKDKCCGGFIDSYEIMDKPFDSITPTKLPLQKLSKEEIDNLKKEGKEMSYITSKKNKYKYILN